MERTQIVLAVVHEQDACRSLVQPTCGTRDRGPRLGSYRARVRRAVSMGRGVMADARVFATSKATG